MIVNLPVFAYSKRRARDPGGSTKKAEDRLEIGPRLRRRGVGRIQATGGPSHRPSDDGSACHHHHLWVFFVAVKQKLLPVVSEVLVFKKKVTDVAPSAVYPEGVDAVIV